MVSTSLSREQQARHEADAARLRAEADKVKAQTEAVKSQQVESFLEKMLQGVGPSVARGQDTTMLRGICPVRKLAGVPRGGFTAVNQRCGPRLRSLRKPPGAAATRRSGRAAAAGCASRERHFPLVLAISRGTGLATVNQETEGTRGG